MIRSPLNASFLAIAAAAPAPAPLWAQEREPIPDSGVIVVTAQAENATNVTNGGSAGVLGDKPAEDLPFSLRAYDETLILNQQPLTLGEVLENDPTIRASYGFGNAAELFVIRGFPLFGDDVGLNGLYGIAPRQLIAPELFSSVQVLNGSSAFLNGAAPGGSGLGGSVNLLLKRAEMRPLTRATLGYQQSGHVSGSFDVGRRYGANGEWGLRVNGAWREGEVAIEREDRRTRVIGTGLDYRGPAFRAALDLAYQDVRVDRLRPKVTIGAAIPAVPESDANYAQDYTVTNLRDVFGALSLEYDLADNALFYARAGARDGSEEGVYGGITVIDAATGGATGTALYVPATANNEAVEAGLRVRLGSAVTQEINFGGNASWQVFRTAFDFLGGFTPFATNLYDTPQLSQPPTGFVGGDLADPDPVTRTRLASAFVSDTLGFFGDRILLTGGLRLQDIRQRNTNYDGTPGAIYDESAVTPVIGLVVKPVSGLSLYANRIEALQQGPTAPIDALVSNPGETLPPRVSVQYEIGGKLRLGRIFAGLALYRIDRPGEGLLPDGEFGYVGDQRHEGLEITVNGDLAPGLRLISGLAYTDTELAGRAVAGVPEWTANADVEWDLPFAPGLTLTGRVVHTGEQWANAANTLRLEPWTRFDLGARHVFAAGDVPVTLRLTVDNVADERYWASAFDTFSAALLQGQPRTVKASISADF
ncbi:TonB-dependent receptor [Qipengyuania sediminis]|uniref:TonB-dependent receptor n=1 Tax=Qipengyuania sediminis TaxID=1532023 RepID=UPI00105A194C|nr:TonB-dependent siderophore receptor [Qipengyuania sediminis]